MARRDMYYEGDLLDLHALFGVATPTTATCMLENGTCSFHVAGCLCSPSLNMKACEIPGEPHVFNALVEG